MYLKHSKGFTTSHRAVQKKVEESWSCPLLEFVSQPSIAGYPSLPSRLNSDFPSSMLPSVYTLTKSPSGYSLHCNSCLCILPCFHPRLEWVLIRFAFLVPGIGQTPADPVMQLPTAGSVLLKAPDPWLPPVVLLQEDANRAVVEEQEPACSCKSALMSVRAMKQLFGSIAGKKGTAGSSSDLPRKIQVILPTLKCPRALLPEAVSKRYLCSVLLNWNAPTSSCVCILRH